jgi:hypothetical protein
MKAQTRRTLTTAVTRLESAFIVEEQYLLHLLQELAPLIMAFALTWTMSRLRRFSDLRDGGTLTLVVVEDDGIVGLDSSDVSNAVLLAGHGIRWSLHSL